MFSDSVSIADAFNNFCTVKLTRYTVHLQREFLRMTSVHVILLTDLSAMYRFTFFNKLLCRYGKEICCEDMNKIM